MKRIITLVLLTVALSSFGRELAQGYRGFFDVNTSVRSHKYFTSPTATYRETVGFVGFSTSHGYQFNRNIFFGAGLDMEYNNTYSMWVIPFYFDFRTDLKFNRYTPFADIRLGYNLTDRCGVYFNPTVGYRFDWGMRCGLNVGIGLTVQNYKYEKFDFSGRPETGHNFIYIGPARGNKLYFSARLGIDF